MARILKSVGLGGVTSPKQEVVLDTGEHHSVCAFVRAKGCWVEFPAVKASGRANLEFEGGLL